MKFISLLFAVFIISTISFSQNVIPVTNNFSFISNQKIMNIEKKSDSLFNEANNTQIHSRSYVLKGENINLDYHRIIKTGQNRYDFYTLSDTNLYGTSKSNNRNYDTLFFVMDDVYGFGFNPVVYVSRTENSGGVAVPTWINDTLGYYTYHPDTLDLIAILAKSINLSIIFDYNYIFNHTDTIYFSASQATHRVYLDPMDESGQSIYTHQSYSSNSKFVLAIDVASGGYFISSWDYFYNTHYYFSDYFKGKERVYFGSSLECTYMEDFPSYLVEFPILDSITDSVYLSNSPDSLVNVVSRFNYYDKRDFNKIGFGSLLKYKTSSGGYGLAGSLTSMQDYAFPYWEGSMHLSMQNSTELGFCYQHYIDYILNGQSHFYIASPIYDEYNDSLAGFYHFTPKADVHYFANGDKLYMGKGLVYYWNIWTSTYRSIHVVAEKMGMWGNWIYPNTREDSYVLKDKHGDVVASGAGLEVYESGLTAGPYTLIQQNSFTHFNGYTGQTIITSNMDLTNTDHTPPVAYNIYFINENNTMKYQFGPDEDVKLRFSAADFVSYQPSHDGVGFQNFPDSLTKVWIKNHNDNNWTETEVNKIYGDSITGSIYESDLTNYLQMDSAIYDIKIYLEDDMGNNVEYTFFPGLIYGDFYVNVPENKKNLKPDKIVIYPNPVNKKLFLLSTKKKKNYNYKIYSLNGSTLLRGIINKSYIDVSSLHSGQYAIAIFENNKMIASQKLTVTR